MAAQEIHQIKDLANLIREKGVMVDEMSEEVDTYLLGTSKGQLFFQAFGEFTNRLYLSVAASEDPPQLVLDVREDTFSGVRYSKGTPVLLEDLHASLKEQIEALGREQKEESDKQAKEGFAIKDGMGSHKL